MATKTPPETHQSVVTAREALQLLLAGQNPAPLASMPKAKRRDPPFCRTTLTSVLLLLAAAPAPQRPAPGAAVIPGFSPVRRLLGGAFEPGAVSSASRRHRGCRLEAAAELHHPQVGQPRPLGGRGAPRAPRHPGLPGKTGMQENQAAGRQVESQQREETHGFAPKIPLEF